MHVVFLVSLAACFAAATLLRYVELAAMRFARLFFRSSDEAPARDLPASLRGGDAVSLARELESTVPVRMGYRR